MIPWGFRRYAWRWRQAWVYELLWRNHPVVVILAGVGVLSIIWLAVKLRWW